MGRQPTRDIQAQERRRPLRVARATVHEVAMASDTLLGTDEAEAIATKRGTVPGRVKPKIGKESSST